MLETIVIRRTLRLALPLWMLTSLITWGSLSSPQLIAITPGVCGAMLSSIGLILGVSLRPLIRQFGLKLCLSMPGLSPVLLAAITAPPIGIAYAHEMQQLLLAHPMIDIAGLLWVLSSMGTVLTVLVCRLLTTLIATTSNRAEGDSRAKGGSQGSTAGTPHSL